MLAGSYRQVCDADRRRRLQGFTLIELLVVVAIIALLISILLPSLRKAREQAKQVLCTAGLKGIATASFTYATGDKNGQAIPVHPATGTVADVGSYDWGGKSGVGDPTQGSLPETSPWGTQHGRGPATRPLNDIIYPGGFTDYMGNPGVNQAHWKEDATLDLKQFRCPSDRGYTGHHFTTWSESKKSSFDHYGNSYAANTLWCNSHQNACVIKSWGPFLRSVSRIPNPANTIYYIENCGRFSWRAGKAHADRVCWTSSDGPHFSESEVPHMIRGWHGKPFQFVTSFVDGHAGVTKIDGYLWPPPTTPRDPQDNPLYWKCHVIRGHGWQLDVLPSMPEFMNVDCALPTWTADTLN